VVDDHSSDDTGEIVRGSRYAFIVLHCLLEKWLSRGDYRRAGEAPPVREDALGGGETGVG